MMIYSLRLALLSLKRHPVVSLIMATAIALGLAAFTSSRATGAVLAWDPFGHKSRLYHVELDVPPDLTDRLDPARYAALEQPARGLLTYRDHTALERLDLPVLRAAGVATRGVLRGAGGQASVVDVRGVTRDSFPVFERQFRLGAAWSAEAEARADRVAVLNPAANQDLFGGEDSVGRRFSLFGEDFMVAGVLDAQRLPFSSPRGAPAGVAIPIATVVASRARPWMIVAPSELASTYDDLLASDARWIDTWVELDDDARGAYEARLAEYAAEERSRGRPLRAVLLVPRSAWWARRPVDSGNTLFELFSSVLLVACTFNLGKLLLAKFDAQARATALFRACGATRREVFLQLMLEAELVGVAGGLLGLGIAAITLAIINPLMPFRAFDSRIDLASAGRTMFLALLAAFVAGVYPAWHASRLSPAEAMRR